MSDKKTASDEQTTTTGKKNRFKKLTTDRTIYKCDECGLAPVTGWLLELRPMPDTGNGPWYAYVIRCTEPTKGVNFEGEVVPVAEGEEILLVRTAKLQELDNAAHHPTKMAEVRVTPKSKVKIGQGRNMWTYTIEVGEIGDRKGADTFSAAFATRQLPKGNGSTEEIPF
jgi:hypothetical protein